MTAEKPLKCCFCINWKTVCYIFTYLLLALQIRTVEYSVTIVQYYYAVVIDIDIPADSDNLTPVIIFLVFASALVVGVAISVVSFTIILLVGLFTENYKFLKMYLIHGTILMVLFVILSIVAEIIMVKKDSESTGNSIAIAFNAYFLYVIRSFWLSLDPNPKPQLESV